MMKLLDGIKFLYVIIEDLFVVFFLYKVMFRFFETKLKWRSAEGILNLSDAQPWW